MQIRDILIATSIAVFLYYHFRTRTTNSWYRIQQNNTQTREEIINTGQTVRDKEQPYKNVNHI